MPKEKSLIDLHFQHYRDVVDDLKQLMSELQVKRENLYTLTGTSYDELVKSHEHVGIDHFLKEIQDLEDKIKSKEEERKELYDDHSIEISELDNINNQRILTYFYLDRLSIDQIASILYLSSAHVKRLKKEAVTKFEKMILNNT